MCIFHTSHCRCGHDIEKVVRRCERYVAKQAKTGRFLSKVFSSFARPKRCSGRIVLLEDEIMTACGTACARTLNDNFKRHQRELKRKDKELEKRKKERLERAQAVAREYRKHKQKEEEALRRQKEEREQKQRAEREKERNGKSRQSIANKKIQPIWHTARGGTDVRTMRPSQPAVQQLPPTRTEAQRAPPRLADRRVLPQAYPQPPLTKPDTHPPRTQANVDSLGRRRQGAQAKLSMPSASGTNRSGSSISRSNARHVGRRQEGTLDDPRVRIQSGNRNGVTSRPVQGSPPVQTVAAQKKPMVSSPPVVPQPARARVDSWTSSVTSSVGPAQHRPAQGQSGTARSPGKPTTSPLSRTPHQPQHQQRPSMPANAELRPPVPPKDPRRPVPAKNNWQPQHPNLAPAPLALQTKPPGRAARAPAQQPPPPPSGPLNGVRRNFLELDDRLAGPKRTTPNRKPVPASNTAPPPRAAQQPPQQQQQVGGGRTPGYRPNPMFANNKKADAKKPAEVSAAKPENKKKNPWFKRLIAPSSEAVNLVEWVSEDAARVERGE